MQRPSTVLAALLAAVVLARVALAVANNAPGGLPGDLAAAHDLVWSAGPTAIGVLVLLLAVGHRDPVVRAGLAVAGAFGLLGLHVPAAALPAAVGVVAGPLAVVVAARTDAPPRTVAVGATLWLGLAVSLSSATGVVDGSLRPVGSLVALLGMAALPLVRRPGRGGWLAGAAAGTAVVLLGATAPFVAGAVVLVAFGIVGAPLAAVTVAAAGGVASLAGAVTAGRWQVGVAVGLVLLAGVPATVPDALAAGTGLALLLGGEPP